jgi:hypothetical protein
MFLSFTEKPTLFTMDLIRIGSSIGVGRPPVSISFTFLTCKVRVHKLTSVLGVPVAH